MLTVSSHAPTVYCDRPAESRPTFPDPSFDAVADRLAWLHDSPDNELDEYPGIGWDDPEFTPSDEDVAAYAAERFDGNDDGRFCPLDLEYWALPNGEYYEAEAGTEAEIDWYEAARVHGHRAAMMTEGGAR